LPTVNNHMNCSTHLNEMQEYTLDNGRSLALCVVYVSGALEGGVPFLILLKQLKKKRNVENNIRIRKLSQPANDPSRALILDKTLRRRKDDTKMVSCKVTDRKQVCPQRRKIESIMKNPG